jgi:phthiocerol/phenolphthiocerol synthesis type-I polyketide synthase B
MSEDHAKSIAIVGIGCRFPGGVDTHEAFLSMLREGRQGIGEIPSDRIDLQRFYDPTPRTPGKIMSRLGGYLSDIDQFDPEFFGLSPREAERMDPQQRLMLEASWEALEDAGIDAVGLKGGKVGVFVGQWVADFEQRLSRHTDEFDFPMTLGTGRYALSGRISYLFGFMGPSMTIDTACSASLVAVHLASQSLKTGESDIALAGGVNVILGPHIHIAYSQGGMMAPDGQCKFGDARADGYVRSEGAGIVALKRLEDALRDGDRIHAVIRGSAVNNDGATSGSMGRPSVDGQEAAIRAALADAQLQPLEIGYVEAHGTGTPAGDRVEIGAIGAVLGRGRAADAPLRVGSVKTNLGHTESAAGVAGLIKAVLAVREGEIAASLNYETPSTLVDWDAAPVRIASQAAPWPGPGPSRKASVNGFGISGTNAHVIIEGPPERHAPTANASSPAIPLLPLSARSDASLRALAGRLAEQLASPDAPDLSDLVRFAQTRRGALDHRAAFLATDRNDLVAALKAFAMGGEALAQGVANPSRKPKTALVFPGQGGQWTGMARGLLTQEPVFRESMLRADAVIRREAGWSLMEQLALDSDAPGYLGDRIDVVQPTLGALAIAYAEWMIAAGLNVDFVVGHSMGEAAAACVAGALSLEETLQVLCRRSALMREKSGQGAMALVDLPEAEVAAVLAGYGDEVAVAAVNSPRACIISGDAKRVAEFVARFEANGVFSRLVKVDVASHSPQMEGPAKALREQLAGLAPRAASTRFVSATLGREAAGADLDAAYWAQNLRQPVRFADALGVLFEQDVTSFVELGAHPVLSPSIEQAAQDAGRKVAVASCGRRAEPEHSVLVQALARAWSVGASVDWSRGAAAAAPMVDFPLYPWSRRRFWVEAADIARTRQGDAVRRGPDKDTAEWVHRIAWRDLPMADAPLAAGRWLLLGDAPGLAEALADKGAEIEQRPLTVLENRLADLAARGEALNVILAPARDEGAYLPVRAGKALSAGATARLWFVTRGAQSPKDGAQRVNIEHAALWGAARVLSDERPEIWGGLLDVPEDGGGLPTAAAVLLAPNGEDLIAVRGERAFAPRLIADPAPAGATVAWRADGAYLLTGGLGDVGLAVAKGMVEEGARRLILAARTPLPPRREWAELDPASRQGRQVATIKDLEAMGAAIHPVALDMSDEGAVRAYLSDYKAEGWPTIRGVIHLAAVLDRALIADTTEADFNAAMAAKLSSALILDRLLPDVETFVLFSSLSTLLPQAGMVGYVAANAGIEALAQDRAARGLPATAVIWGHWHGAGLIGDADGHALIDDLAKRGLGSFAPAQGAAVVSWAAGRETPLVAIMPTDWTLYGAARSGRSEPLLKEVKSASQGGGLSERLAQAQGPEKLAILHDVVAEAVARTLHMAAAEVDAAKEFGAMGLTSLLAMELRNRLERALGVPLAATLAWNYPTVTALAAHLAGASKAKAPVSPKVAETKSQTVREKIAAATELSDDDVLLALRNRRKGGA